MGNLPLRVPPNGPYVESDAGGRAVFGHGAIMREAREENNAVPAVPEATTAVLAESAVLEDASPDRVYECEVVLHASIVGFTTADTLSLTFERRDNGGAWTPFFFGPLRSLGAYAATQNQNIDIAALSTAVAGPAGGGTIQMRITGTVGEAANDGTITFPSSPGAEIIIRELAL